MTALACYVKYCVGDLYVQCLWNVAEQMLMEAPVAAVLVNIAM